MSDTQVGRVAGIHRYPVKSMRGEALAEAAVDVRGVAGDRQCAPIDVATGRVASAKLPHRWRALLACGGLLDESGVTIELPDGSRLSAAEAGGRLSLLLGREVRVAVSRPDGIEVERADPEQVAQLGVEQPVEGAMLPLGMALADAGFADFAPLHLLTDASLGMVGMTADQSPRFRPNLVIETTGAFGFVENDWIGQHLTIGPELRLEVFLPTPRCAVPTLPQGALPAAPTLMRTLSGQNRLPVLDMGALPCLGAYARVLDPGRIAVGDAVRLVQP